MILILKPKLLLMIPSVYECVFEWLNVTSVVKCFELSIDWKSAVEMQIPNRRPMVERGVKESIYVKLERPSLNGADGLQHYFSPTHIAVLSSLPSLTT